MLTGARQTGKTYAVRRFGKDFKAYAEINFIDNPEAKERFSETITGFRNCFAHIRVCEV